jgi:hypothetical protein
VPEVDEEDDKAAELEALLEQFREPEEAPRMKKTGPLWVVLAMIASVAGCWLALQATQGTILGARNTATPPMKPAKAKDRSAYYAAKDNIDVEADYRERCRKGMTAKEVRWIVEDFEKEGLAEGPDGLMSGVQEVFDFAGDWEDWTEGDEEKLPITEDIQGKLKELSLTLANRQQAWYCGALADGLRFTREQKIESWNNSRAFVSDSSSDFLQFKEALDGSNFGSPDSGGVFNGVTGGGVDARKFTFPTSGLLLPDYWIRNERCAPWNLCRLDPDQLEIVRDKPEATNPDPSTGESGEDEEWFRPEQTVLVGNREVSLPSGVDQVGGVLPLTGDQDFPRSEEGGPMEDDMLSIAMKLHPAQLKLLLLLDPHRASILRGHLDPDR